MKKDFFVVCLLFLLLNIISYVNSQKVCFSGKTTINSKLTENNPLRGFLPYQGSAGTQNFPCSMEYNYIAMKDLMTNNNTFNWNKLENLLNDVKSRSRQTIFRLYLDYPNCCPDGQYNTGVPAFLFNGSNPVVLTPYSSYGGGKSPNYNNERLVSAMESLIRAMGKKYDGDNRIAFIKLGLLGFWGEWHTYPHNSFMASRNTQLRIIKAYNSSFTKTKLVVSADELQYWEITNSILNRTSSYNLGWHDDNFGEATYSASNPQDWFFYNRLVSHSLLNTFRNQVFGGEIQPTIQSKIFTSSWTGQNFTQCVQKTMVSWLLNQFAFQTDTNTNRVTNTKNAALLLGYQFHITSVNVTKLASNNFSVTASVTNRGSAPFYYPLTLQMRLFNLNGSVVFQKNLTSNLNRVMPATTSSFSSFINLLIPPGARLGFRMLSNFVLRSIFFATNGATREGMTFNISSCA